MSEIKKGSVVTVQVHVKEARGGRFLITLGPGGMTKWIDAQDLQLVEPPPFNVGDRVDAAANGKNRVIDRILTIYHLRDSPDNVTHTREELTPVPPKPEYRVVRVDDTLMLLADDESDGRVCGAVSMSDPKVVNEYIDAWAREFGIDADAARKLAAKQTIIGKRTLGPSHYATAIRAGSGWFVTLTARYVCDMDSTYLPGDPQDESTGKGIFPGINGPYEVKL